MENLINSMVCFIFLFSSVFGFERGEIAWGVACLLVFALCFAPLVKDFILPVYKMFFKRLKKSIKDCRKENDDEQRD